MVHRATTPTTVTLSASHGYLDPARYDLQFEKDGYHSSKTTLTANIEPWYFGNLVLGGLVGLLVVDPLTGSMWKLESSAYGHLYPLDNPPEPVLTLSSTPPIADFVSTTATTDGVTPLLVTKWQYDQQAQTAVFAFTIKDEMADIFTLSSWALQQIRQICTDEYMSANAGAKAGVLGFSLVSSLNRPDFHVDVTVYTIRPMSHHYDSATRTGVLTVDIGWQGDINYAGTYKWALDNIGVICSSKEVGVESGQPLPEGARFEIISEKTNAANQLEITFRVIQ